MVEKKKFKEQKTKKKKKSMGRLVVVARDGDGEREGGDEEFVDSI